MALREMPAGAASNLPHYTHSSVYAGDPKLYPHGTVLPALEGGTLSFTQHTLKMTVATESLKIITIMGEEFGLHCFVLFQMKVYVVYGPRAPA